ncbi:hypothetical protein NPIL_2561 [Nephila pilipes]|uniref:Mos1 transposase HTH domain-containing protein n=1 Tax=Nephila pilipes TaxID=299642 RepID=A0A8X6TIW1_NEPPI|nr:hypothetical protein NPIL_2561 [Nephila pilipes]
MASSIRNSTKRELRSFICFLHVKDEHPADIHQEVSGDGKIDKMLLKWYILFEERIDVHEYRTGESSVTCDAFYYQMDAGV